MPLKQDEKGKGGGGMWQRIDAGRRGDGSTYNIPRLDIDRGKGSAPARRKGEAGQFFVLEKKNVQTETFG